MLVAATPGRFPRAILTWINREMVTLGEILARMAFLPADDWANHKLWPDWGCSVCEYRSQCSATNTNAG